MRESICNQHLFARAILDADTIVLELQEHPLYINWCICQILDIDLFKSLVVTLNSEGMAKDIGVELFCSEDTEKHFTLYVDIMLLHRHKSLGSKGNWAAILEEVAPRPFWDVSTWTVTRLQTWNYHSVVSLQTIVLSLSNVS